MKLHTNVFFFATLMVVSFAVRAEAPAVAVNAGLLDKASEAAVAAWDHVCAAGEQGVSAVSKVSDVVVVYAKDGAVAAGQGVTALGNKIQEYPGYTAAAVATVVAGYTIYKAYFAPCENCKKPKTKNSNN